MATKRKKTPKSVTKIIASAKREQNKVLSKMVAKIGKLMTPKKRRSTKKRK